MGEPNAALGVYMNDPDGIRSVPEFYLGEAAVSFRDDR